MIKKRFSKKEILIILGASLFQFAFIGILPNSLGIFLTQIKNDVGLSVSRISAFTGIKGFAEAILAIPFTYMVFKLGYKKSMFAGGLLVCSGFLLMTFCSTTVIWYLIPVLMSCTASLGAMCVPYLLQDVFPENGGTTAGIAMSASGIGGALFNVIASRLILYVGWRNCIYILSALTMLCILAACRLIYANINTGMTLKRTVSDNKSEKTVFDKNIYGALLVCTICILGTCMGRQLIDYISMFINTFDYSLQFAAVVSAFSMVGNFGGKFLFGLLDDRIGFWKAIAVINILVALGGLGMTLFSMSRALLCIFALFYGLTFVGPSIGISRGCIAMFGPEESKKYSGVLTTISSILRAATGFGAGIVFESTSSFSLIFVLSAVSCLFSAGLSLLQGRTK